jgi:hypothetical protein
MKMQDRECYSVVDIRDDLQVGDTSRRFLFHGDNVDPQRLVGLWDCNRELFSSGSNICSSTPFLLAAALVLNRLEAEVDEMFGDYGMKMPQGFEYPIRVDENLTLLPSEFAPRPKLKARVAITKQLALGKVGTGIAIVDEDCPGTYIIRRDPELPKANINRLLNSAPYNPDHTEDYWEDRGIREALGPAHGSLKYPLMELLRRQIPNYVFIHEILRSELAQIGVEMPSQTTAFTTGSLYESNFPY